ncbi:ATP-binding cassette domain-containing protein [Candidatus Woesearchaeota archaeon]|nr:ATP-binding cassette domain-containing protein [Candidatus Woesearchaeota archaeon]
MKTLNNNGEEKDQQEANRFLYRENDEERERGEIIPTAITVRKLSKSFKVKEKRGGFIGNLKSLVSAKTKIVTAVDDISFTIKEGELVGFIGPNGAGKSTTIKMLSGILFPTKGSIRVLNYNPQEERIKLTQKIGTIFGQKQQLWYHLPPIDSFELFSKIYEIDKKEYEKRLKELVELFEIQPYLYTPVRKLSLGERMRCEFVASLLHKPKVLFLDEPTIGLDIIAKKTMREYIKKINKKDKTTIILTSHDLEDIEALCPRIIIINKGKLLYDGSMEKIKDKLSWKRIELYLDSNKNDIPVMKDVKIIEKTRYKITIEVDRKKIALQKVLDFYLSRLKIVDIVIEDPPIEKFIEKFYGK